MERILIVDDDETTIKITERILQKENYEVDTYSSAKEAARNFEQGRYNLILSDYFMPDMDGGDFLDFVRERDKAAAFVFLTANTDVRVAIELVKKGADDHITKPIIAEELLFRVRKNLKEKENEKVLKQAEQERALLDMENQKLVNWRVLYASKDINQTEQMISLLSRSINQSGGFLWLDLLKGDLTKLDDTSFKISKDLVDMILNSAEAQKNIFDYITFISDIDNLELDTEELTTEQFIYEMKGYMEEELRELSRTYPREYFTFISKDRPDGTLTVDREYTKKIFRELIINAIKYSPEQSRILLFFEPNKGASGQGLNISVRNTPRASQKRDKTGAPIIGIPYDFSELVFDLFYTIDNFPTFLPEEEWSDGTGLFVSRKLIRKMGGWIRTNNGVDYTGDEPNTFVNFTITLPISNKEAAQT